MFHEKPENHHCEGVDWEGIELKKKKDSEALRDSYQRKMKDERDMKELIHSLGFLILLVMGFLLVSNPIFISSLQSIYSNGTSALGNFLNNSTPKPIDRAWVQSFVYIVNIERAKNGLGPLTESPQLNAIAYSRFNTMVDHYDISHYGAGDYYGVGEVVFYPSGTTPQDYATTVKNDAPLHWNGLMSPLISSYGYYLGTGQVIGTEGSCSTTEIPGPGINETQFFQQRGCQPLVTTSTWLVIDIS